MDLSGQGVDCLASDRRDLAFAVLVSLVATDRSVEKLSGSLTRRVIATTDALLMGFFEPVQSAVEISAERIYAGEFETFPLEALDRYFSPLIEGIPQLSSLTYSHFNGDEYTLIKVDGAWQSRHSQPETWGAWADWREWSSGAEEKPVQRRKIGYDARVRPWHRGAIARFEKLGEQAPMRDRIHWTKPYKFFTTQAPGVTASLAQRIASGRLVVLGLDILLSDISKFTSQLEIGQRGKVFVLRGKPEHPTELVVVGLPADERFSDEASMIEFVLSPPVDLGGPVASFVNQTIDTDGETLDNTIPFSHQGERWWGAIARSRLRTSDDIWVGSVVPENELLAGLPNTNIIVIIATGVFVLLAVLRSLWLARRYATALEGLTDRGNQMQRLNFEPIKPVESNITEIRDLTAALERMRRTLRSYSSEREDLRIARSIRTMSLPAQLPAASRFELKAWHEPAVEVGGDSYDAVQLSATDGHPGKASIMLVYFDTPGTGVGATVYGNQLRAAFRASIGASFDLCEIAMHLDRFLHADLPQVGPVRAWIMRLDAERARLQALGLGQDALLCLRGGVLERITGYAGPLGLQQRERELHKPKAITLERGDTLVLASNGILDALNRERQRFGLEGVECALQGLDGGSPGDLIARLRQDLAGYSTGSCSDRTLIVLQATG